MYKSILEAIEKLKSEGQALQNNTLIQRNEGAGLVTCSWKQAGKDMKCKHKRSSLK
jgi:hypothetical protein